MTFAHFRGILIVNTRGRQKFYYVDSSRFCSSRSPDLDPSGLAKFRKHSVGRNGAALKDTPVFLPCGSKLAARRGIWCLKKKCRETRARSGALALRKGASGPPTVVCDRRRGLQPRPSLGSQWPPYCSLRSPDRKQALALQ